jgi:esterase
VLPDASIEMPVPETPEAIESAKFTQRLLGTLQENLKSGDSIHAAEVFINTLSGPGAWSKMPEPVRQMILTNIYTALGDTTRPLTTCQDLEKFDFPVLLLTGQKSPRKYEFFYNEMRKCMPFPATVVVPNAAHGMQRHNSEFFNNVVLEFIAQH